MARFKRTSWLKLKTLKEVYGIKIKFKHSTNWMNVSENNRALFYTNKSDRDNKIVKLRKEYHGR